MAVGGAVSAPADAAAPAAPLSTSWSTSQGAWAIVAMGKLDQLKDTFWQVFFRPEHAATWSLVTPPAVADNGGLVAAGGPTAVTVGFEPSEDLDFSPVAQSTDDGRSWSPGVLPASLLAVPDALAAGPGGRLLALVRTAGGTLVSSPGPLSSWRTVSDRRALAASAAGRSCGLVDLRAVADASGDPVVGGSCTVPGVVGVLTDRGGSWHPSGLRLPSAAAGQPTSVLRLVSGSGGTAGLVTAGAGRSPDVYAIWRSSPSAEWSVSGVLHPSGTLVATASGPNGSLVVVSGGHGGTGRAESVSGPGAPWTALPALPRGTATVSEGADGVLDALVVATARLVTWQLDPAGVRWIRGSTVTVPIQYGSST
jgi:hypothetical protein